ncbi:hypothetical protein F5Y00DRAFT_225995 [Daldinia vernicosa]|uniref:uncharacterized protein n=1 Tax=Daldinia vernicosa TaxID=114800 RepID=UPI0020087448|nr:uncharacterized protein F5Y00DRAFT_225995 [Daldinia vernicosa]KAI0852728.1 hypothetical protein F5Y00DRAFT_225995 [Daldinia vernicosa]
MRRLLLGKTCLGLGVCSCGVCYWCGGGLSKLSCMSYCESGYAVSSHPLRHYRSDTSGGCVKISVPGLRSYLDASIRP